MKKQTPEKLLWLAFSGDFEVDVSVRLDRVRGRLKGLAETGLEWSGWEVYLPIVLPAGADRDKTLDCIVAQLEHVAELIDPEGPTYG